jgi:uncharacterized protein YgiM (DUF1202 family)
VPDGKFATLLNNPGAEGKLRPLFSMVTFNPNEQFQMGQIVDLTGDGNTFAFEDIRLDGESDRDYNDIVIQVRGAVSQVDAHIDEFINPARNWRDNDFGRQLESYTRPYMLAEDLPIDLMPVFEPISVEEAAALPEGAIDEPNLSDFDIDNPAVRDLWEPTDPAPEELWPGDGEGWGDDAPMDGMWLPWPGIEPEPLADQPLIGIIDTGFASENPDLDYTKITTGTDFVSGDRSSFLTNGEGNEHGTHILGVISAQAGNDTGIDGINPDAPVWVSRAVGSGRWADALIEFVDTAQASGQPNAVVNLSMDLTEIHADGEEFTRYELTLQERAAIEYARQNGVLIVAAAGNDGGVMSALGQASQEFDNIITVGAAEQFDPNASVWQGSDRADYSSYGKGLDIMAAGGTATNPELSLMGNDIGTMAGTSVATAKVTGAASQVWAANPDLSYRQVINILKQTATDLGETGFDLDTGAGFLNLTAAVSLAKLTEPQPYELPPTLNAKNWSGAGFMTPGERAVAYAIVNESFSGWVMPSIGVALRNSQRHEDRSGLAEPYRKTLSFDAWTYGERVTDYQLGTPDELWYRLAGTNYWVPSAYIYGYPGSRPPVLAPTNPAPTPKPNPEPSIGTGFNLNQILGAIPASLRQYAKISIPLIVKEATAAGITDLGQLAYILATSEHESKAGLWMEELASGAAYEGRLDLGNTQPGDGVRFKGRGYVQVTGRANYTKWAQKLGVDLVGNPALAADPAIAAKIITQGMRDGSFTGVGLSRYINGAQRDFINARRIVNGTDRAATIAAIAERYYNALVAAQQPIRIPTPQPTPVLNKPAYVNSSIGLNFRSGPSTGDRIIGRLTNRTPLTLLKKVSGGTYDGRNDWYQVKVGNTIGYVAAAYIREGNPPAQPKPGYVNAAAGLNFRTWPSTANSRITTLANGTALTILEEVTGAAYGSRNDWYKVQVGNTIGYVAAAYVIAGTKPNPGNPGNGGGPIQNEAEFLRRLYGNQPGTITQRPHGTHWAIDSVQQGRSPRYVYALAGGTITRMTSDQYGGKYIDIYNSSLGKTFRYLHFNSFGAGLSVGKSISAGTVIGVEGYTGLVRPPGPNGRHTHFAVLANNRQIDPWPTLRSIS